MKRRRRFGICCKQPPEALPFERPEPLPSSGAAKQPRRRLGFAHGAQGAGPWLRPFAVPACCPRLPRLQSLRSPIIGNWLSRLGKESQEMARRAQERCPAFRRTRIDDSLAPPSHLSRARPAGFSAGFGPSKKDRAAPAFSLYSVFSSGRPATLVNRLNNPDSTDALAAIIQSTSEMTALVPIIAAVCAVLPAQVRPRRGWHGFSAPCCLGASSGAGVPADKGPSIRAGMGYRQPPRLS